jgi:putative hydrolase of the HAD superfamily
MSRFSANGLNGMGVLLDLDDTLYPERSYFESGLTAVAEWLTRDGREATEARLIQLMYDVRDHGRKGVLDRIPCPAGQDPVGWKAALLQVYRTHMPRLIPFSDVDGFIARTRLEGYRIGLVTDGKSCVQWRKLVALGLASRFDAVICTEDLDTRKPDVKPFLAAAALLGVKADACVYLSDDPSKDFIGPNRLGMKTVQVRRDLPFALARPAPDDDAEAGCRLSSLTEAAELLFGATL